MRSRGIAFGVLVGLLLTGGCPQPEPEVPAVAGTYPLTVTLLDGDCIAQDPDLLNTSFLTWIGDTALSGTMELTQSGGDLTFDFEDCSFFGLVNADEEYYFSGDCVDQDGAALTVASEGQVGPSEDVADRATLAGEVTIDVDYTDEGGTGGPDGTLDCFREVEIAGDSF